jgi:16S rRNA (uracil1498-N3)-methyltransferase
MRRFFLKSIPENNTFELPEEESKHMIRVLRMNVGETCILLDGKGQIVEVQINDAHPKRCGVSVLSREQKTLLKIATAWSGWLKKLWKLAQQN